MAREVFTMRVSDDLRKQIKEAARQARRNESDLVRIALEDWLNWRNGEREQRQPHLTAAQSG